MKPILSSSILVFIISFQSFAQNKPEDVVYLKNGSVIHGTILETVPDQTVKIQTADHNIFIFKMDEVARITKASPDYFRKKERGYTNYLDVGYLHGIGDGTLLFYGNTLTHSNDYNGISILDVSGLKN